MDRAKPIRFDTQVNLGNLIMMALALIGFAVAWGELNRYTKSLAETLAESKASIVLNETRIRALEQSAARQDERLMLILDSLRKIEQQLERGRDGR